MNKKLKAFVVNGEGFPQNILDIDIEKTAEVIKKHKDSSKILFMNENEELILLVVYGEIDACDDAEWEMQLRQELNN